MGISRRAALIGGAALAGMAAGPAPATAWSFEFPSIDEGTLRLAEFQGRVLLVVNTASFCGFTPQYRQLEALHRVLIGRDGAIAGTFGSTDEPDRGRLAAAIQAAMSRT